MSKTPCCTVCPEKDAYALASIPKAVAVRKWLDPDAIEGDAVDMVLCRECLQWAVTESKEVRITRVYE